MEEKMYQYKVIYVSMCALLHSCCRTRRGEHYPLVFPVSGRFVPFAVFLCPSLVLALAAVLFTASLLSLEMYPLIARSPVGSNIYDRIEVEHVNRTV